MTVFSDPRVIRALADFVPVTQNTAFTQWHQEDDELSRFYKEVADQAPRINYPYDAEAPTTQGLYAFGADGVLYSAGNFDNPEEVLRMLRTARDRFQKNPPAHLKLPGRAVPVQPKPPAGSLVVRCYSRVLPLPAGAHHLNGAIGRDFLWIRPDEVKTLARSQFPPSLARRLTLYHLLDNVRGQPDLWEPKNVKQADFQAQATQAGALTAVRIWGLFQIEAPAGTRGAGTRTLPPSGYSGRLEGLLEFDTDRRRVVSFRCIADGQAWGESTYTEHAPPGRFPLKIAFVQAEDEIAWQIAPHAMTWATPGEYLR